jgi:hypothetical protein
MSLERRIIRLEGKRGGAWRRGESALSDISLDELKDIYKRVRAVVSPQEAAMLDELMRGFSNTAPPDVQNHA